MRAELEKVVSAVGEFYRHETCLLDRDIGERALTHRLAVHIERQFPDWDVDCNYDRLGERVWQLPRATIVSTDDAHGKSIFPDIVVHRRKVPENLLAIELRKASNHQGPEHDRHKLRALTDPRLWFAYRAGLLLTLGRTCVTTSEAYAAGALDGALSGWLTDRLRTSGFG